MDGLLIVDKPSGPTSHDVVAIVRRLLGVKAGHTGTLDPLASGVLPILVGRATRLAQFMSGAGKTYEATVRLGISTDTYDALGIPVGPTFDGRLPGIDAVDAALARFRGTFEQQPPAYSAKKIGVRASYALARRARAASSDAPERPPALPMPVRVTAHAIEVTGVSGADVYLRIQCSAGFYVRALAHDLGAALGTGAHLAALRRTAVSGVDGAPVPLADLQGGDGTATAMDRLVPMGLLLPHLPALTLVPAAVPRVRAGRDVDADDAGSGFPEALAAIRSGTAGYVRILDPAGALTAIAQAGGTAGLLHPFVVLM